MHIPKVTTSVYLAADPELREMLDNLATTLKATSNWKVRKKAFLDIIDDLQLLFEVGPEVLAERLMEGLADEDENLEDLPDDDGTDDEPPSSLESRLPVPTFVQANGHPPADEEGDDAPHLTDPTANADGEEGLDFPEMLPLYVGALLERLEETEIRCAEQAAVYILSIHREHQEAAEAWLIADWRNGKAFKKLLRADRRYAGVLEMMEEYFAESGRAPHNLLPPDGEA
ncbi:MAG TPA: hypothetical protein VEB64_10980 [Azospirillaceae bacterium]|nr:hypothetical protein [Azospirillaceae bacterium]